ncbi:26141_t:CDS:2 [Dentiscutata erythropus]|uniref:26141_t:CDS:1 n=1 Tax=Dentiscutata erythropus TaxID=1348616 RepID=A0A9N9JV06_9GLOM|nr:26141_t:CDS:2 [Dentiscutata erythropus]
MARNKIEDIRDEYTIRIDEKGKERYKCKACKKEWAKNITRLQEHINTCALRNLNETSNNNKRQKVSNLTSQEQIELESLLARAFYTSGVSFNVIENIDFQAFLKKACPSFNIPSRHTLSNSLLDKEYMNLQVVVQNTLDETPYHCLIALVLTVDTRWTSTFECLDHVLQTQAAIYAILTEDGIELDENIKAIIVDYTVWADIKKLRNFLEPFIIFIRQLESDEPYLSSAYKILQDLKKKIINNVQIPVELRDNTLQAARNRWVNFLYNPAIIVAYMLDPRYRGEDLDLQIWADIINNEVIRIAGVDNENQVLDELAEYIGKSGGFARKMLTQKADKLVYIYWNTRILRRLGRSVLINNSQEISVNSDNQELDINVDDDKNEELNGNFTDFSNWLLNTFDNCEHEFDNYSE